MSDFNAENKMMNKPYVEEFLSGVVDNIMKFMLPAWGKKYAVVNVGDAPESTILRFVFLCVLAMLTLVGFFYAKGYLRDEEEANWKKKYLRKSNVKPDMKNNKKKTRKSD